MISPSNVDLVSLRIFVVVAHTTSLTKAAQRVHMTLSAVSRRISDLEAQFGEALFERRASGLALTEAGQMMLPAAQRVVVDVERLSQTTSDYARGVRGRIRIWANTSSTIQFLPRDLYSFRLANPEMEIELEERLSHETTSAVLAGQIDLGIVAGNASFTGLHRTLYKQDRLVVVAPRTHPVSAHQALGFEELAQYDLVGTNRGSAILQLLTDAALARGLSLKIKIQVSSFDAILSMVEAGHGVSVLPVAAITKSADRRTLALIPLSEDLGVRKLWIVHRPPAELSRDASRLLQHLACDATKWSTGASG